MCRPKKNQVVNGFEAIADMISDPKNVRYEYTNNPDSIYSWNPNKNMLEYRGYNYYSNSFVWNAAYYQDLDLSQIVWKKL